MQTNGTVHLRVSFNSHTVDTISQDESTYKVAKTKISHDCVVEMARAAHNRKSMIVKSNRLPVYYY